MMRKILVKLVALLCLIAITTSTIARSDSVIPYEKFREGDILYHHDDPPEGMKPIGRTGVIVSNKIEGKIGMLDHSAIIVKDERGNWAVRESHPKYGGVHTTPIEEFYLRYHYEGIKHLQVTVNDETAKKAADWAKNHEGKWQTSLFRFIKPDWQDDKYYCSEFVYMSYKGGAKINLAPKPFKLWISPEDISLSKKVKEILPDGSKTSTPLVTPRILPRVQPTTTFPPPPWDDGNGGSGGGLGGVDFTDVHLSSIYSNTSISPDGQFSAFSYILKAKNAEKDDEIINIEEAAELSLNSFFTGLALPESEFWVNLNPWEPDRIIEKDLETTDVGRIMLEADLQMKKSFSEYENPCVSNIGEEYWKLLEEKREELIKEIMKKYSDEIENVNNVLFASATRHWIVPDRVEALETDNEIFITNASLKIYSEPVYEHSTYQIVNQNIISLSRGSKDDLNESAKEFGRYAEELDVKMILPLVVKEVNQGKNYSDLRQVYISLALAQWYKNKYRNSPSMFDDYIDSKDLKGLEAKSAWSSEKIWRDYKKSFEEGDFQCWKNETFQEGNRNITKMKLYYGGGVDFSNIKITNMGSIPQNLNKIMSEAAYSLYAKDGNDYYFGDMLYVLDEGSSKVVNGRDSEEGHGSVYDSTPQQENPKTTGFEAIFAIVGLLTVVYLIKKVR